MCKRYIIGTELEDGEFREIMEEASESLPEGVKMANRATGDIFPNDIAPALMAAGNRKRAVGMRWGFGSGNSAVHNARSETALEKPMFRFCVRERRCLLPALGYYEWNARKERHFFHLPDCKILYFAGIYRSSQDGLFEYTILTREAYEEAHVIHARMPLIISDAERWLYDKDAVSKLLTSGGDIRLVIERQTPEQLSMFD